MSGPTTRPSAPAAAPVEGRNRLGEETSPYLLQHRDNPVNWWAWGPEAFAAARALDRPIFLSIGYSTCYWCHVMERESFENEEVARILNESFVCIKVDREERPDVDDVYMTAVQVLNRGQGGWPMSVFLEPETLKPFLAGTYFPPEDAHGRPGFKSVLRQVAEYWTAQRDLVTRQADQVAQIVAAQLSGGAPDPVAVGGPQVRDGVTQLLASFDRENGGWGRGTKFPMTGHIELLMSVAWDEDDARSAVLLTLDRMATGGLHDQIGGGFHRYTVDTKWLVPHFEKMLYDNAQLASAYAAAYDRTGDAFYAQIVRGTLDYVLREMTSADGAFFTAQDAEVDGREGASYVWSEGEVRDALAAASLEGDVDFALDVYGLKQGTNFRDPHHPDEPAKNVLYLRARPQEIAAEMGMDVNAFAARLHAVNAALLAARDRRDQPRTDDKVIAGWNGLMIRAMAEGGRVLDEPRYVEAAHRAAVFVLTRMRGVDGGLHRTWRVGTARIDAFLDDYALMIEGLLALYRAAGDEAMLVDAVALARAARDRFWDRDAGGWFDTLAGQGDLFVRTKSTFDGALPTGYGVMLNDLIDLYETTGDDAYLDDAVVAVRAVSATIADQPVASVKTLLALNRLAVGYADHPIPPAPPGSTASATPGESAPVPAPGTPTIRPVTLSASPGEARLAPGASVTVEVTVRMAPGYHVNAHEPGLDFLVPLSVALVGGAGVTAEASYPRGERIDGPEGAMYAHGGAVTIPVRLTRTGPVRGRPTLTVTYQACTDAACLAPRTETLEVGIEGRD